MHGSHGLVCLHVEAVRTAQRRSGHEYIEFDKVDPRDMYITVREPLRLIKVGHPEVHEIVLQNLASKETMIKMQLTLLRPVQGTSAASPFQ